MEGEIPNDRICWGGFFETPISRNSPLPPEPSALSGGKIIPLCDG
jgi:hypothetical protein